MNEIIPVVSIVTPTYNSAKYIIASIESVKAQTFKDWELIIVDDCSSDKTVSLIETEMNNDNRIILMKNQTNLGAAKSRNLAIEKARGQYIAFLDSDDLWVSSKLVKQLEFMEKNNAAFSFTSYEFINEKGESMNRNVNVPQKMNYNDLLKNTIIGCLTVMIDVTKVGKIKMPDIRTRQDTAMWLKILKTGTIAYGLNEPLAKYRKVNDSLSSNKFKMIYKTWRMYRDVEKLTLFKTTYVFIYYIINALKKHK